MLFLCSLSLTHMSLAGGIPLRDTGITQPIAIYCCKVRVCCSLGRIGSRWACFPAANIASPFASVGLRVSMSHDLGEITCEIACNLIMLFANMLFADIRYTH